MLDLLSGTRATDELGPEESSLLVAEARASGILPRLAGKLLMSPSQDPLPPRITRLFSASLIHAEAFRCDVWRELRHIEQALTGTNDRVILLKGASYVLLGLPAADGRIFSDIDILVDRSQIEATEASLMLGGWSTGKLDAYDQRYYRQWSHEIPPLTHLRRGTTVDLHHSLAMPTCRVKVNSGLMLAAAVPVTGDGFWWRLCNEDIILHATSHLVLNAEFDRGLRDLWDIDLLYRHFAMQVNDFPARLLARARAVGLEEALRQTLAVAARTFATPVATGLLPEGTSLFARLLMLSASTRHPQTRHRAQPLADLALMLRELWLRLPWRLLLVHLAHKTAKLFAPPAKTKA